MFVEQMFQLVDVHVLRDFIQYIPIIWLFWHAQAFCNTSANNKGHGKSKQERKGQQQIPICTQEPFHVPLSPKLNIE